MMCHPYDEPLERIEICHGSPRINSPVFVVLQKYKDFEVSKIINSN